MQDRIFGDREKAMEEAYFRQVDANLLKKLRESAQLDEIALALGRKLQLDDPELMMRVKSLGVSLNSAPALFLAPLVQVAWADGSVSHAQRRTVLRLAEERGIETHSPAHAQLHDWLRQRPEDALFATAVEVIRCGFSVLPRKEREERIRRLISACNEVAKASGKARSFAFALVSLIRLSSQEQHEAAVLESIAAGLRRSGNVANAKPARQSAD